MWKERARGDLYESVGEKGTPREREKERERGRESKNTWTIWRMHDLRIDVGARARRRANGQDRMTVNAS